jgi:hypothetical protein
VLGLRLAAASFLAQVVGAYRLLTRRHPERDAKGAA